MISGGGRTKGGVSNFSVSVRSRKKRKLRKAKNKAANDFPTNLSAGDRIVVETLCTNSWVDVVWQVFDSDYFHFVYSILLNRLFVSFFLVVLSTSFSAIDYVLSY